MLRHRLAATILVTCWCAAPINQHSWAQSAPVGTPEAPHKVFRLHTEFLPYAGELYDNNVTRLGRELVRQAVLITARDELGMATCDQTVHETCSAGASVVDARITERASRDGTWHVELTVNSAEPVVWTKDYDYEPEGAKIYDDIVTKLEADVRGALRKTLQDAGLPVTRPSGAIRSAPDQSIEDLLTQVDFIAQFIAVQRAHQAIASCGETPEWLGVLARGYANLAFLTEHQWNSASEVFTARAWLYAQRMVMASEQSRFSLWHRAYARALGGTLHLAERDLEKLQAGASQDNDKSADSDLPGWTALIQPYCMCDREGLMAVGQQHKQFQP